MLAAALVPDTVLLLPGVAGRGPHDPELTALGSAARAVVARAVRGADRVVVVAPGALTRSVVGAAHLGAGAVGVPDHLLTAPVPDVLLPLLPQAPAPAPGPPGAGAVVGVRLCLDAGVPAAALHVVEVATGRAAALRTAGAVVGAGRTALVVVGSGSARHGPDAPLPGADGAADLDGRLLRALRTGTRAARDVLAGLDAARACALGVSGWAPWQVLVGALDAGGPDVGAPDVVDAVVWRGAAHAAVAWGAAA